MPEEHGRVSFHGDGERRSIDHEATDNTTNDSDSSSGHTRNHSEESVSEPKRKSEARETVRPLMFRNKPISPTSSWNLHRRNPWFLSWQIECWAMIFSMACMVAVTVVMAWLDGKKLSVWRWAIQPNAVVSILVVASKAALMVSTASCISQLKWTHFQNGARQLRDLEDFDDASRGAWGSLRLLCSRSAYHNAAVTLGCVVTVLVLAMETFGQQLLSFPERDIPLANGTATFPVIQDLLPYRNNMTVDEADTLDPRNLHSLLALMDAIYDQVADPPYNCPSASCSWDMHSTLGVCSSCEDVSKTAPAWCHEQITVGETRNDTTEICEYDTEPETTNLTSIRQGYNEVFTSTDGQTSSTYSSYKTTRVNVTTMVDNVFYDFGDLARAFNFSVLVIPDDSKFLEPEITHCSIYYCAWVYENSTSQSNEFYSNSLKQYPLGYKAIERADTGGGGHGGLNNMTFSPINGSEFPSDRLNDTFWVSGAAQDALIEAITDILSSVELMHAGSSDVQLGNALLSNPNITALAERFSEGATNIWRQYNNTEAVGTAWETVTFIQVDWPWIALPVSAIAGACALLLITLVQNRRTVLWKSSVLAYSFRPMHGWEDDELDVETLNEIRRKAGEMRGQLKEDVRDRIRLVKA